MLPDRVRSRSSMPRVEPPSPRLNESFYPRYCIETHQGLGDNIYERAFIKRLGSDLLIKTPWPELYSDLPGVRFVRPDTRLRTQSKNVERSTVYGDGHGWPRNKRGIIRARYSTGGIRAGMQQSYPYAPGPLDLPHWAVQDDHRSRPYILVRPVTLRSEWRADSRNPEPEYVYAASIAAMEAGHRVVSVADLQPGAEWAVGRLPPADEQYHRGELDTRALIRLAANAKAIIGGIGWIVPLAIAANVPALIICGGNGGYNSPDLISWGSQGRITWAVPDNHCKCTSKDHDCDKRISNIDGTVRRFIASIVA